MQLLLDNVETLRLIPNWTKIRFPGISLECELKLDSWCKDYDSSGRYHTNYWLNEYAESTVDFYFEKDEDAIMFALMISL